MPTYLGFLNEVVQDDIEGLREKQEEYGNSWMKRGGIGAFMMLARKWDRIEKQVERNLPEEFPKVGPTRPIVNSFVPAYDIFAHLEADERPEGLADDIKDLRRYLLLVEAEMRSRV